MALKILHFTVLAVAMSIVAACSPWGDDDAETNGTPAAEELTAESVLERAADRWDETDSLHFELEASGDSFLDSDRTIRLVSANGDLVRPSSVEATARVSVTFATVNVNIIVVGDNAYMTNLITGDWERAPDDFTYNPALLFNPDDGLGPIMQSIRDPELDGTEEVEGRPAHRIVGTVSEDQIEDITAGSIEGENIDVTVWIAEDNHEVLRLFLSSPGESEEATTWDLVFTGHNLDVVIDEPI